MFFSSYALMPWALLALRAVAGVIFIVHGMPKLQKSKMLAGAMGMSTTIVMLIGLAEMLGGLSLLLGLVTQLGCLVIGIIMIGALNYKIGKWHLPFSAIDKMGWEFDLLLLVTAFAVAILGPSQFSLDWLLFGVS